jgi:gluconate 2-dehydrogenase gamma chain
MHNWRNLPFDHALMSHRPLLRRDFVGVMAGALAVTWVTNARQFRLSSSPDAPPGRVLPGILTAEQRRDLDALTALIIPTDETPGAREAGAVDFIDHGLGTFAGDQRTLFTQGLADLDARARRLGGKAFADLDPAAQLALAGQIDAEKSEFFEAVRTATIAGFLANPEYGGNTGKVGWQLIGFEDQFGWQAPFGDYDRESSPD